MGNPHLGQSGSYNSEDLSEIEDQRSIFVTFPNPHKDMDYLITSTTDEFTTLCPVTGQPDFATITIETTPDELCIELKSLKMYLMSFRNRGEFHEQVAGRITKDIIAVIKPRKLRVIGDFTVRGGIATRVVFEYPQK